MRLARRIVGVDAFDQKNCRCRYVRPEELSVSTRDSAGIVVLDPGRGAGGSFGRRLKAAGLPKGPPARPTGLESAAVAQIYSIDAL
jgi:hypothetical protein